MAEGKSTSQIEYRQILAFPGYRVGTDGSVWSCWKSTGRGRAICGNEWRRLKESPSQDGHLRVYPCREGKPHQMQISRLVLEAFTGPCPEGMQACHFPDSNPANNNLNNLRWDTGKSNWADRIVHGSVTRGEKNGKHILQSHEVIEIRKLFDAGVCLRTIAEKFNTVISNVRWIGIRKTWAWLPEEDREHVS